MALLLVLLISATAQAQQPVTSYGYDAQGNRTSINGPLSGTVDVTTQMFDALNRLKQVTNPVSGVTQYGYDGQSQLVSVTDPRGNSTSYTVDGLGNLTQEVSPDRGNTSYSYDAAGNLVSRTDARGKSTSYSYDALNRLLTTSFADATYVNFTYDQGSNGAGRLTSVTFPGGQTSYGYDAHGHVTSKQDTHAGGPTLSVSYGYSASTGQLSTITYPSGKVLSFSYDAAGRVSALAVGSTGLASTISYFPFGQPAGWVWGNGAAVSRSFDLDGRLVGLPLRGTVSRTLTYDAASRLTAINDPTNALANQTLGYDVLDRLTNWTQNTSSRSYAYDANGNRTSLTIGANSYAYTTPGSSNRLASTAGPLPLRSFSYDAAGNLTGDGQASWAYNDRGRLASVTRGGHTVSYRYDGLGQRVSKQGPASVVPTGAHYFVYDEAGKLLGEYDANGQALREYVYLGDMPLAILQGTAATPTVYYVYADQVNRPWVITNVWDQERWRWDTSPFGELAPDENPSGLGVFVMPLRYPGQYADVESGLHYNYFRDYDPQTGRYVQSDPIGLAGGINPYRYVGGNPLSWTDSFGLYTEVIIWTPVGAGQSAFGHVSTNINGENFSFTPGGWDTTYPTVAAYLERQQTFRGGRGYVLNLSPLKETQLQACLRASKEAYSLFTNNCGTPIQMCLDQIGASVGSLSILPTSLEQQLQKSPLTTGTTFHPSPVMFAPMPIAP